MIKVASLPLDVDLLDFSQVLESRGLPHRIAEEAGRQVIYVRTEAQAEAVRQALMVLVELQNKAVAEAKAKAAAKAEAATKAIMEPATEHKTSEETEDGKTNAASDQNQTRTETEKPETDEAHERERQAESERWNQNWNQSHPNQSGLPARILRIVVASLYFNPLTAVLLFTCTTVALATGLGVTLRADSPLTYPPLPTTGLGSLLLAIDGPAVFLRTLAPILLHFSPQHLIFNLLWVWFFGRQLERMQSKWVFFTLVLLTAFVGNTAQYLASGANNFGGISGVGYGLVGYTWVIHQFMPRSYLLFTSALFYFFIAAMTVMFLLPGIANFAHAGGLITGLLAGQAMTLYYKFVLRRDAVGNPWR